jgi:hypothetical protein
MERIMEDFINEIEAQLRGPLRERIVGLQLFIRRLILLNGEKVKILMRRFNPEEDDADNDDEVTNALYDTIDNKDKLRATAMLFGHRKSR